MTNLDILEAKREFNKWLKELTESENLLLMEMMDEAIEMGYNDGQKDAHSQFLDVCQHFSSTAISANVPWLCFVADKQAK